MSLRRQEAKRKIDQSLKENEGGPYSSEPSVFWDRGLWKLYNRAAWEEFGLEIPEDYVVDNPEDGTEPVNIVMIDNNGEVFGWKGEKKVVFGNIDLEADEDRLSKFYKNTQDRADERYKKKMKEIYDSSIDWSEESESEGDFERRVEERTGVKLKDIQKGERQDVVGGHIFCRRDELYVVNVGQPSQEEDGTEIYPEDGYRVVDLSEK